MRQKSVSSNNLPPTTMNVLNFCGINHDEFPSQIWWYLTTCMYIVTPQSLNKMIKSIPSDLPLVLQQVLEVAEHHGQGHPHPHPNSLDSQNQQPLLAN